MSFRLENSRLRAIGAIKISYVCTKGYLVVVALDVENGENFSVN